MAREVLLHSTMSIIQLHRLPPPFLRIKSNPKNQNDLANNLNFILKFPQKSSIKLSDSLNFSSSSSSDSLSSSISSLQSIKPYIQSEWRLILQGWTCSAISVFSLSKIVPKAGEFSLILGDVRSIKREGAILASFFVVRLIANYLQQAFLWEAASNSAYKIRAYIFQRVLERDLGFFEGGDDQSVSISSGDISHRITSEASDVAETIFALLNTIVPCTLQLSAMAAQMLVISPVLSTISALVIPSVVLAITLLGAKLQRISRKAHQSTAALSAYLNEVLPSILFVKASNMEWTESVKFQRLAHADLIRQLKKKKMKALIPQMVQAVYVGGLLTCLAGSLVLSKGFFNTCSLISFVTSSVFLVDPIQIILQGVGKAYNELKQGEPAIERLFDLTRFKPQVIERADAKHVDSVRGEVKFCDISFQYKDGLPLVLNGVDLHIKAGEIVALVGPSGGGKTTLAKLLLRLYDPLHGHILIDGIHIQCFRLESLRRHVALVSQDIMLFSGTVAENIGYKDLVRGIDLEKVELAAKTANADEFISLLPRGYETYIESRGSILSGGQKQRLAIARAIYQDSSILVMDEATSALDSRSELLVRQAMERVMKNHTVLIISHRLETVLMAERVLLLEDGRLQEVDPMLHGTRDVWERGTGTGTRNSPFKVPGTLC
ncbi:ABC transporter B family member 29, chloroplastic isoform X1 [Spinacia oleracea]|uniref:ABC transporter B family member 29, chloroplastic isoform X1 n=1 Tax=Spinacia oleracea TaxID=3562 RepID=A0ABM3RVI6_SPIOL|nr:ABC transporter B family member 29, chloroplastic isoform X1 [Spinacia oleracea]